MENDIDHRSFLDKLFLRLNREPRNSTEIDPSELLSLSDVEKNDYLLDHDIEAFETTQRNVSFGIIAAGGLLQTIVQYPEEPNEIVHNFIMPAVVQVLNFTSFRIGLSSVRKSVENLTTEAPTDITKIEENKLQIKKEVEYFKIEQLLVSIGVVVVGSYMTTNLNPPEDSWDWVKNTAVVGLISIANFVSFRKGFSLIRGRAQKRLKKVV